MPEERVYKALLEKKIRCNWLWKQKYERAMEHSHEMFVKCYVWCSGEGERPTRKTWITQGMISNI